MSGYFGPLKMPPYRLASVAEAGGGYLSYQPKPWVGTPLTRARRDLLPVCYHQGQARQRHGVDPDDPSQDGDILFQNPTVPWGAPGRLLRRPRALVLASSSTTAPQRVHYDGVIAQIGPQLAEAGVFVCGVPTGGNQPSPLGSLTQGFLATTNGLATGDSATGTIFTEVFLDPDHSVGGELLLLGDEAGNGVNSATYTAHTDAGRPNPVDVPDWIAADLKHVAAIQPTFTRLRIRWWRYRPYQSGFDDHDTSAQIDAISANVAGQAQSKGIDAAFGGAIAPLQSDAALIDVFVAAARDFFSL